MSQSAGPHPVRDAHHPETGAAASGARRTVRLLGFDSCPARGTISTMTPNKVQKTDEEWRAELSPDEYAVLREAGTERPWTGPLLDEHRVGVYRCRACGNELFRSDTKFESHCGWPSFYDPADSDAVLLREDRSMGMKRIEVLCGSCHSHLGHVFEGEGYPTPTDQRYCINSISLKLVPES